MLWQHFMAGEPAIDKLLGELGCADKKAAVLEIYRTHEPDIHLYDGVAELLGELRKKGIRTGIITDGRPTGQRNKLKALGLQYLVDDFIITDELGGTQFRKPCDIAFRIMLTKWRLNPADVIYIGDNAAKDFQAPQQLGMKWLWFDNTDGIYQARHSSLISKVISINDVYNFLNLELI